MVSTYKIAHPQTAESAKQSDALDYRTVGTPLARAVKRLPLVRAAQGTVAESAAQRATAREYPQVMAAVMDLLPDRCL